MGSEAPGYSTEKKGVSADGDPDEISEPPADGADTDERYSPSWLVEKARAVLGAIDLIRPPAPSQTRR